MNNQGPLSTGTQDFLRHNTAGDYCKTKQSTGNIIYQITYGMVKQIHRSFECQKCFVFQWEQVHGGTCHGILF